MSSGYFHRVQQQTSTGFWINNPTRDKMEQAIAAGAISCTTNPSFCARLISEEPEYIRGIIDTVAGETPDDDAAAERVYDLAAQRIMHRFAPATGSAAEHAAS